MWRFSSSSSLSTRFLNRSPSPAASALLTHSFTSHGGSFSPSNEFPVQRGILDPKNPSQISRSGGTYSKSTTLTFSSGSFSSSPYPVADENDLKEGEVEEKDIPKANGWSSSPYSVADSNDSRRKEEKAKIARRYEVLTSFPPKLCRLTPPPRYSQDWVERRTTRVLPHYHEIILFPFKPKRDRDSYIRFSPILDNGLERDQDCCIRLERHQDGRTPDDRGDHDL